VTSAGRIAEELYTQDVSNGAAGDIKQMTRLSRKMVCEWGMSDRLGMVEYGEHEDYVFLARDMSRAREYSEATAQEIDREVRRLVDEAYNRAKQIITENRTKLEIIAKALLEFETLDAEQIKDIIEHGEMRNPPSTPPKQSTPPPIPQPEQRPEPDFPPGLAEQPA
jgi:cell division protease FtsH